MAPFGAYGRGAYVNAKRARKMSAFVPMRGRKDGRDATNELGPFRYRMQQSEGRGLAAPFRESDLGAGELSLVRLAGPQAFGRQVAVPRQFVDQLQLIGAQLARQQRAAGQAEPMIESKFRRAFHPMRGKRARLEQPNGSPEAADTADTADAADAADAETEPLHEDESDPLGLLSGGQFEAD